MKDLDRIRESSHFLLALINDILDFAGVDAGQTVLYSTSSGMRGMVAAIESLVTPQAVAKGLAFRRLDGKDVIVRADEDRVRQVIVNIVSNAVKFTPPGGSITLACDVSGEYAWISVTDDGPGRPSDKLARIFEPFVQLSNSPTYASANPGLGLGLAISRDLVRQMGGGWCVGRRRARAELHRRCDGGSFRYAGLDGVVRRQPGATRAGTCARFQLSRLVSDVNAEKRLC
jgi:signal transduction histidine kinase